MRRSGVAAGVLVVAALVACGLVLVRDGGDVASSAGSPATEAGSAGSPVTAAGSGVEPSPRRSPELPARRPGEPAWQMVPSWSEQLDRARPALGSAAVYVPRAGIEGVSRGRLPVVVLLGEPGVHRSQYEQLAHEVASYGLLVVVPERLRGARAVRAAQRWADGADRARRDRLGVLTVGTDGLAEVRAFDGADRLAAYVPAGAGSVDLGPAPALAVVGDDTPVGGGAAVVVRRPGSTSLTVTDEGARGPTGVNPVGRDRQQEIASVARWFGTWFAAQDGDRLSREFLDARLAATAPGDDGSTVTSAGRLPW